LSYTRLSPPAGAQHLRDTRNTQPLPYLSRLPGSFGPSAGPARPACPVGL